jgi:hypothetical protein
VTGGVRAAQVGIFTSSRLSHTSFNNFHTISEFIHQEHKNGVSLPKDRHCTLKPFLIMQFGMAHDIAALTRLRRFQFRIGRRETSQ